MMAPCRRWTTATCLALLSTSGLALMKGPDAPAGWICGTARGVRCGDWRSQASGRNYIAPGRRSSGSGPPRMAAARAHPHQQFHVAPMQAYTNRHLRRLCRLLSQEAVLWTEMEKTEAILESNAAAERRLRHDARDHCVLQLGGNDITRLQSACRIANQFCFDEINLNCGCPSVETGGADFGATMMLNPGGTGDACAAMADVSRAPISVKCRLGAHHRIREDGTLPEDNFEALANFVYVVSERAPVKHWVVHCRAAVLAGLSPAKNRCVPPLRPDFVLRLAQEFPDLDFTLNGGISSIHDATRTMAAQPSLQGVMAGRFVLQSPLDLAFLDVALRGSGGGDVGRGGGSRATSSAALEAIEAYLKYAHLEALGVSRPTSSMNTHTHTHECVSCLSAFHPHTARV